MTVKQARIVRAANPECTCPIGGGCICAHCLSNEVIMMHRDRMANMKAGLAKYRAAVKAGDIHVPNAKDRPMRKRVRCDSPSVRSPEVIVTVYPHGELGLRAASGKGRSVEYKLPIGQAYVYAANMAVLKVANLMRKHRKAGMSRKDARKQARKDVGL